MAIDIKKTVYLYDKSNGAKSATEDGQMENSMFYIGFSPNYNNIDANKISNLTASDSQYNSDGIKIGFSDKDSGLKIDLPEVTEGAAGGTFNKSWLKYTEGTSKVGIIPVYIAMHTYINNDQAALQALGMAWMMKGAGLNTVTEPALKSSVTSFYRSHYGGYTTVPGGNDTCCMSAGNYENNKILSNALKALRKHAYNNHIYSVVCNKRYSYHGTHNDRNWHVVKNNRYNWCNAVITDNVIGTDYCTPTTSKQEAMLRTFRNGGRQYENWPLQYIHCTGSKNFGGGYVSLNHLHFTTYGNTTTNDYAGINIWIPRSTGEDATKINLVDNGIYDSVNNVTHYFVYFYNNRFTDNTGENGNNNDTALGHTPIGAPSDYMNTDNLFATQESYLGYNAQGLSHNAGFSYDSPINIPVSNVYSRITKVPDGAEDSKKFVPVSGTTLGLGNSRYVATFNTGFKMYITNNGNQNINNAPAGGLIIGAIDCILVDYTWAYGYVYSHIQHYLHQVYDDLRNIKTPVFFGLLFDQHLCSDNNARNTYVGTELPNGGSNNLLPGSPGNIGGAWNNKWISTVNGFTEEQANGNHIDIGYSWKVLYPHMNGLEFYRYSGQRFTESTSGGGTKELYLSVTKTPGSYISGENDNYNGNIGRYGVNNGGIIISKNTTVGSNNHWSTATNADSFNTLVKNCWRYNTIRFANHINRTLENYTTIESAHDHFITHLNKGLYYIIDNDEPQDGRTYEGDLGGVQGNINEFHYGFPSFINDNAKLANAESYKLENLNNFTCPECSNTVLNYDLREEKFVCANCGYTNNDLKYSAQGNDPSINEKEITSVRIGELKCDGSIGVDLNTIEINGVPWKYLTSNFPLESGINRHNKIKFDLIYKVLGPNYNLAIEYAHDDNPTSPKFMPDIIGLYTEDLVKGNLGNPKKIYLPVNREFIEDYFNVEIKLPIIQIDKNFSSSTTANTFIGAEIYRVEEIDTNTYKCYDIYDNEYENNDVNGVKYILTISQSPEYILRKIDNNEEPEFVYHVEIELWNDSDTFGIFDLKFGFKDVDDQILGYESIPKQTSVLSNMISKILIKGNKFEVKDSPIIFNENDFQTSVNKTLGKIFYDTGIATSASSSASPYIGHNEGGTSTGEGFTQISEGDDNSEVILGEEDGVMNIGYDQEQNIGDSIDTTEVPVTSQYMAVLDKCTGEVLGVGENVLTSNDTLIGNLGMDAVRGRCLTQNLLPVLSTYIKIY